MRVLVSGAATKKTPKELIESADKIGDYFSEDRFYTLTNCQIDEGLRKYSAILYVVTVFLFRSYNYKHLTDMIRKKPKWVTVIDVFCILCLIVFVVCFVTGIASPIIQGIQAAIKGNFQDFANGFKQAIGDPVTITLFSIAVFTFVIALMYIYVLKKVVAANKKLALKDYVITKVSFVNRFGKMIRVNDKMIKLAKKAKKLTEKNKINHKIKPDKFYLIENIDILANPDRWLVFQISNLMYNLFPESGLIFIINEIEEADLQKLQTICKSDFKYIAINEV